MGRQPYQEGPVYYTSKGDYVYAFYIPEEDNEVLPEQMRLGAFVPASLRAKLPCEHIWGFKIKVK